MKRIQYEFGSTAYRSKDEMLDGIAYEFWTGQGWNSPEMVTDLIEDMTPEEAATECIDGWQLDMPSDEDGLSHMDFNEYTAGDLAAAMRDFMETRPDKDGD